MALEVAEQIVAFVERGEIKNAVNIAAVRAEVLPRVAPWLDLAGKLGTLLAQILPPGGIDEVEIETTGEVAELAGTPVARAALAGLLRGFCDVPVNEVNASLVADERGLRVVEVKRARGVTFAAAVTLRARAGGGTRTVKGTIFQVGDQPEPRIVQIDDFVLDATPEGRLLLIGNADRPGVIGRVGTLLGDRGINVARLHVGRRHGGGQALMLWQVDAELDEAFLDEVRRVANVESAARVIL